MNQANFWAVVAAGGSGSRMHQSEKKQFLPLSDGRTILAHSLSIMQECPLIKGIVLICAAEDRERSDAIAHTEGITKLRSIAGAGTTRQQSVLHGLEALHALLNDDPSESPDYVAIHDAARPYLTQEDLLHVLLDAQEHGASCLAVPVKDTIKQTDANGFVIMTPPRDTLWSMQTPQVFRMDLILAAHRAAVLAGDSSCTDDAQVLERYGNCPVHLCRGSYTNRKITTQEDL